MGVTFMHDLKRCQGAVGVTTVGLQLCVVQGNRQFGLRLAFEGTFQQVVAFFVMTLFVCGTSSAQVIE
ncbi:hypothetical protein D3C81_2250550 [compost metagenome]